MMSYAHFGGNKHKFGLNFMFSKDYTDMALPVAEGYCSVPPLKSPIFFTFVKKYYF